MYAARHMSPHGDPCAVCVLGPRPHPSEKTRRKAAVSQLPLLMRSLGTPTWRLAQIVRCSAGSWRARMSFTRRDCVLTTGTIALLVVPERMNQSRWTRMQRSAYLCSKHTSTLSQRTALSRPDCKLSQPQTYAAATCWRSGVTRSAWPGWSVGRARKVASKWR